MELYIMMGLVFGLGVFFMVNSFGISQSVGKSILSDGDGQVRVKGAVAEVKIMQAIAADLSKRIRPESGDLEEKLRRSGYKYASPVQFHANRMFWSIIGVLFGIGVGMFTGGDFMVTAAAATGGALYGFTQPARILDGSIRKRRENLLNEMGFALDTIARNLDIGVDMAEALGAISFKGMFARACAKLGNEISLNRPITQAIEEAKQDLPETPQFDEFLMLVKGTLQRGGQMADSFKVTARVLRERQRLEIIRASNAAKLRVTLITSVVIMAANLIVTAGPSMMMLSGMGAF